MTNFQIAVDKWASLSGNGSKTTITGEFLNVMAQLGKLAESAHKLLALV